jgi:hypothetical protein
MLAAGHHAGPPSRIPRRSAKNAPGVGPSGPTNKERPPSLGEGGSGGMGISAEVMSSENSRCGLGEDAAGGGVEQPVGVRQAHVEGLLADRQRIGE